MEDFEDLVRKVIKEMFEQEEIEIITGIKEDYDGKVIETIVKMDGKEVFKSEESIRIRF